MKYEESELEAAFRMVADPDDWRGPINAVITEDKQLVVEAAVIYYTGVVPTFTLVPGGKLRVKCVGYRNGPCGP